MNFKKSLLAALLISLGSGAASQVQAAGFAVFTHGASALGQGNAVTAHTSSPDTIFYNPALMNGLDGTQAELGTTLIYASRSYEPFAGTGETQKSNLFFPSHIYLTHKFNDSLSAGLGVFNPFGLGTEWNEKWVGRYTATKSELTTYNFNPAVSYRIIPSLSVAVGIDVIYLDASLKKKVPSAALPGLLGIPAGTDIEQRFKGNGTGVGFNLGMAWDPVKDLTIGASYRSKVKVDVDGDATFKNFPTAGVLNSSGSTKITLPPQFTAAIAYKGIDRLILEAGMRFEGWSTFDNLDIRLDNGARSTTPRDWSDSWGFNLGASYKYSDTVALLAGYVYGTAAAPDSSFDPSIPDAPTHVFCLGTDLQLSKKLKLALAYGYQHYEERTKANTVNGGFTAPQAAFLGVDSANGTYQTDGHLAAVSLGYKF